MFNSMLVITYMPYCITVFSWYAYQLLCDMFIGDHMVTIPHITHYIIRLRCLHMHHTSMILYRTTVERVPFVMQPNQHMLHNYIICVCKTSLLTCTGKHTHYQYPAKGKNGTPTVCPYSYGSHG